MIALLLGLVLARNIGRPLRELTTAIRSMSRGNLRQKVAVRSHDELGELTHAFNQMSDDLERATALRRQMTADIAHELRTPLTVISGYLESLRDGILPPTQERLDTLYEESQHLARLVEDLRTLSLADAGELSLHRQATAPRRSVGTAGPGLPPAGRPAGGADRDGSGTRPARARDRP